MVLNLLLGSRCMFLQCVMGAIAITLSVLDLDLAVTYCAALSANHPPSENP